MLFCHSHLHLGVALVLPYTCCGNTGHQVQVLGRCGGPNDCLPQGSWTCGSFARLHCGPLWLWQRNEMNVNMEMNWILKKYLFLYIFIYFNTILWKSLEPLLISLFWDGCSSGGRAGHLPTRRLVVGSLAAPVSSLHVYVFLGKILHFKSLSIAFISVWICESVR